MLGNQGMNLSSFLVLSATCLAAVGCSAADNGQDFTHNEAGSAGSGGTANGGSGGLGGSEAGSGGSMGGAAGHDDTAGSGGSAGAPTPKSVGIVVIDVQRTFVTHAATPDMPGIIDRTKAALQLAEAKNLPTFITFEDSKQGDHALDAALQPVVPDHAQDFIKTTFAATGLPSFADAVTKSGLTHLVVMGAETDVCVLQTVLGLRKMGFTVLLQKDAVFTSEPHTSPAVRRMQQAGTLLVDQAAVAAYVAKPEDLPAAPNAVVRIVEPLHMGVVLNSFTNASVGGNADPLKTQKSARLRELLMVSEWFSLPVYVADVGAGLPSAFAQYYQGQLRPMSQIAQDSSVTQLVFAGADGAVAGSMSTWLQSKDVFVMEDALLAEGSADAQKTLLQPLFDQGLVPTTYKSFYYDMTKSVDLSQWPSQSWLDNFDKYYNMTQAPEDLPPMPPD